MPVLNGHMSASVCEPLDISLVRNCLQHWPFSHGKGVLLRLFGPVLRRRAFVMQVEPGVVVPAQFDDYMIRYYFAQSYATDPAVRLSRSLLRPGDIVFDVGANIGLWAMGAAHRVASQGMVHAFEPAPANYRRLCHHARFNALAQIRCRQLAVSNCSGKATFYESGTDNSGLGSLAQRGESESAIEVETVTLDGYCQSEKIQRVDFIKVDVEGGESLVFRGATGLLSRPDAPILMFEASEDLAVRFGSSTASLKLFLAECGYEFFRPRGSKMEAVRSDGTHEFEDLFALKPYHRREYPLLNRLF
jgi:FkbM family methyltransferase